VPSPTSRVLLTVYASTSVFLSLLLEPLSMTNNDYISIPDRGVDLPKIFAVRSHPLVHCNSKGIIYIIEWDRDSKFLSKMFNRAIKESELAPNGMQTLTSSNLAKPKVRIFQTETI
jgi:hypothetical protein